MNASASSIATGAWPEPALRRVPGWSSAKCFTWARSNSTPCSERCGSTDRGFRHPGADLYDGGALSRRPAGAARRLGPYRFDSTSSRSRGLLPGGVLVGAVVAGVAGPGQFWPNYALSRSHRSGFDPRWCATAYRLIEPERVAGWAPALGRTMALGGFAGAVLSARWRTNRYRCLDQLLEHKRELFSHLRAEVADLFAAKFAVLPGSTS